MATRLFLDDDRDPREWLPHMRLFKDRDPGELDDWAWITTAHEAIALLEAGGIVEVSLDHDLGPEEEVGTGYDVLLWLEEQVATDEDFEPPAINIHTGNLGARTKMESAVRGIENLLVKRGSSA